MEPLLAFYIVMIIISIIMFIVYLIDKRSSSVKPR